METIKDRLIEQMLEMYIHKQKETNDEQHRIIYEGIVNLLEVIKKA